MSETQQLNVLDLNYYKMLIETIMLKGKEHKLIYPIEIFESDFIVLNGSRMIKMYNEKFNLFGYCTDLESARICMREELNMIIDSYLFDPDYIHKKPIFEETRELQNRIRRHVYGN